MAFADWIPTIINVGSSLFGGGGSSAPSAPSAPSSSGIDWGSILQGVGQLASRVEMVPGAGALDEDIRKANRFNLLAGLLGGGAQLAGGQMQAAKQASEQASLGKDLSDILSGKATYTGQPIAPASPALATSQVPTPIPTPEPTPQAKSALVLGLMNKYPGKAKELLEIGAKMQTAEAEAVRQGQEQQRAALTAAGNIFSRPGVGNIPVPIAEGIVAQTGLPTSGIGEYIGQRRQQAQTQQDLEAEAARERIGLIRQQQDLTKARQRTEETLLEPKRQRLKAQTQSAVSGQSTSLINSRINALGERLRIEQSNYEKLRDQPSLGLTPEQQNQKRLLLENSLSNITELTSQLDENIGELSKRGEAITVQPTPSAISGLIQATPRSQITDTLKAMGVQNAEQAVDQYIPQEGDVMMAPIDVEGTPPPELPGISQRVALEQAPIIARETREEEAKQREKIDKADKIFSSKADLTFRDNRRQQESLTQAAKDLTRRTDAKGNPLTPNQILINQVIGIKSFVRGIDFSVVYQTELEDAISRSSSNLDNLLRKINSWLDNPQALDASSINGYLAIINGRLDDLRDVNKRLINAKKAFRNDYVNKRDRPVEDYLGELYQQTPNELVKTVKAKLEKLGGEQSRPAQPPTKFKTGQNMLAF